MAHHVVQAERSLSALEHEQDAPERVTVALESK